MNDDQITEPNQNAIIDNLPSDVYFKLDRMSKHRLDRFAENPWKFFQPQPPQPTPSAAITFGCAAHSAILTPDLFLREFIAQPPEIKVRRGNAWKAFLREQAQCKTIISQADMELCMRLHELVNQTSLGSILRLCTRREVSVLWTDALSGVKLKARLDAIDPESETIAELKTCQSCRADAFMGEADTFGYDVQAAMYCDALRACGKHIKGVAFLCVEKAEPISVAVHWFDPESDFIEAGRLHYQRELALYSAYIRGNEPSLMTRELPVTKNLPPVAWSKRYREWKALKNG